MAETKTFTFYVKERPSSAKSQLTSAKKIFERMKPLVEADQESFWVIGLNSANREIYQDCLFVGGMQQCVVDLRILFKRLLAVGACAFVVVHNHPGGICKASVEDINLTTRIKKAADILDLNFLDHVIISDDGHWSLKYRDLM